MLNEKLIEEYIEAKKITTAVETLVDNRVREIIEIFCDLDNKQFESDDLDWKYIHGNVSFLDYHKKVANIRIECYEDYGILKALGAGDGETYEIPKEWLFLSSSQLNEAIDIAIKELEKRKQKADVDKRLELINNIQKLASQLTPEEKAALKL